MHPLAGTAARVTMRRSILASATRTAIPRITMRQHLHKHSILPPATNSRCLYSTSPPPSDKGPHTTRDDAANAAAAASLPSAAESRRSALNLKFSEAMDRLQARALTASQTLNDVTGYSSIEAIKADNDAMEQTLGAAQERVRSARAAYKTSNTKRAATQREVTTLLARKDTWTPADLERFTELYRTDHVLEGAVAAAQEALTTAEADEQGLNQRLNAGILKRYHEEQIWSDRIRRASTWGTWGLMGMNFVLFVLLQFFAEPWRRRRLVRGVVEHEAEVLAGVRAEMEALRTGLEHRMDAAALQSRAEEEEGEEEGTPTPAVAAAAAATMTTLGEGSKGEAETLIGPAQATTWGELLRDPARWRAAASDLCSDRQVHLRMKDATTLVLQGAAAGAAIVGGIAVLAAR